MSRSSGKRKLIILSAVLLCSWGQEEVILTSCTTQAGQRKYKTAYRNLRHQHILYHLVRRSLTIISPVATDKQLKQAQPGIARPSMARRALTLSSDVDRRSEDSEISTAAPRKPSVSLAKQYELHFFVPPTPQRARALDFVEDRSQRAHQHCDRGRESRWNCTKT